MKIKQLFNTNNKEVPFGWIGGEFIKAFGDVTVSNKKVKSLIGKPLPRNMTSTDIQTELKPDFVSLEELYETLKTLDHDIWGLFYIRSGAVSRLVRVHCFSGHRGWYVYSYPFTPSFQWNAGYQVFSRDSRGSGKLETSDALTLESLDTCLKALEDWAMSNKP